MKFPEPVLWHVRKQVFIGAIDDFLDKFDFAVEDKDIGIDFADTHIWGDSGVGAVDRVVLKIRENRNRVEIVGLDNGNQKLIDQLAIFKSETAKLPAH